MWWYLCHSLRPVVRLHAKLGELPLFIISQVWCWTMSYIWLFEDINTLAMYVKPLMLQVPTLSQRTKCCQTYCTLHIVGQHLACRKTSPCWTLNWCIAHKDLTMEKIKYGNLRKIHAHERSKWKICENYASRKFHGLPYESVVFL